MPYVTNKSILDNQSRDYVLLTCTVYKSLVCKMEYHSWRPHMSDPVAKDMGVKVFF